MKIITNLFILLSFMTISFSAYAVDDVQPVINQDVTVLKGATAEQCPSSYKQSGGVDQETNYTGAGQTTSTTSPGVQSCTGCSIKAGDCVCDTCYTDFVR